MYNKNVKAVRRRLALIEHHDWRLDYSRKSVSDLKLKNLDYDIGILDDVAALAVLSLFSEDMNLQVEYLVDQLSRFKKPSRTTRVLAINQLYEKAQEQGYTFKACFLPHEQCKAFYLFCNLTVCYKDLTKLEQIFQNIDNQPDRWSQQIYLVDFYSTVASAWLGLYWRFIQENNSKLPKVMTPNTDNLSLIAEKRAIRQPLGGDSERLDLEYWKENVGVLGF